MAGPGGPRAGQCGGRGLFRRRNMPRRKADATGQVSGRDGAGGAVGAAGGSPAAALSEGRSCGRPPIGLERMLRIYFLQQWYGLADEALEDALYDSQALRGFAGVELSRDPVPDATTVLHFRHWLERHDLTRVLFDEVGRMLEERSLLMRQGQSLTPRSSPLRPRPRTSRRAVILRCTRPRKAISGTSG